MNFVDAAGRAPGFACCAGLLRFRTFIAARGPGGLPALSSPLSGSPDGMGIPLLSGSPDAAKGSRRPGPRTNIAFPCVRIPPAGAVKMLLSGAPDKNPGSGPEPASGPAIPAAVPGGAPEKAKGEGA